MLAHLRVDDREQAAPHTHRAPRAEHGSNSQELPRRADAISKAGVRRLDTGRVVCHGRERQRGPTLTSLRRFTPPPPDARLQRQAGVRHLGRGTRQPPGVADVFSANALVSISVPVGPCRLSLSPKPSVRPGPSGRLLLFACSPGLRYCNATIWIVRASPPARSLRPRAQSARAAFSRQTPAACIGSAPPSPAFSSAPLSARTEAPRPHARLSLTWASAPLRASAFPAGRAASAGTGDPASISGLSNVLDSLCVQKGGGPSASRPVA